MNFKYLVIAGLCLTFSIVFIFWKSNSIGDSSDGVAIDALFFDETLQHPHKITNQSLSSPQTSQNFGAQQQSELHQFNNPYAFYKAMRSGMQEWNQTRGYYLAEIFNDYQGADSYKGTHPYGYLNENQLKELAANNDVEAQFLYAKFYLKDKPEEAIQMLSEIVVNTNQTAPLVEIGTKIFHDIRTKTQVADEGSAIEVMEAENNAYAYFLLMDHRKDITGRAVLNVMGYDQFDQSRKIEIEKITASLQENFLKKRKEKSLADYSDVPLDVPQSMGITVEDFNKLKQKFYFSGVGLNDVL